MVNFEDHDWEELGDAPARGARDVATALKVAAGVLVGTVLGGAVVFAVDHELMRPIALHAAQASELSLRAPAASAGPAIAPTRPAAEPAGAAREPPAPELPARAGPGATASLPREAEAQQRAQQQAAERKALAWARYYTPLAQCENSPGKDTIVECANHFIRARREFEAAYAAGRL